MNWLFGSALKTTMVTPEKALAGRDRYAYAIPTTHTVLGTPARRARGPRAPRSSTSGWAVSGAPSAPSGQIPGVVTTAVGYQGGFTPFPTLRGDLHRR